MPNVLTTSSTVSCGHPPGPGGAVKVESDAKLKAAGASVLLLAGISGKDVDTPGCGIVVNSTSQKCKQVSAVTAGSAAKLKVGGEPVILDTVKGSTNGTLGGVTPQLLLAGVANQDKLRSV